VAGDECSDCQPNAPPRVDRRAAVGRVLGDVQHDVDISQVVDELVHVVSLVGSEGEAARSRRMGHLFLGRMARISSFSASTENDRALVIVVLNKYFAAVYRCHYPGCIERLPSSGSRMVAFRNSFVIEEHEQAVAALQTPKRARAVASQSAASFPARLMHTALLCRIPHRSPEATPRWSRREDLRDAGRPAADIPIRKTYVETIGLRRGSPGHRSITGTAV
jgi:hypothetical protein